MQYFSSLENRVANFVAQGYEENLYGSHYGTGQGQAGSETYQSPGGQSTPSRGGRSRPSQPPPAPPSNTSSNSTPTVASANNTPTRGRSMSTGRDTLPPPPPPPGETMSPPPMNGNFVITFVLATTRNLTSIIYIYVCMIHCIIWIIINYVTLFQVQYRRIYWIEMEVVQTVHCPVITPHPPHQIIQRR